MLGFIERFHRVTTHPENFESLEKSSGNSKVVRDSGFYPPKSAIEIRCNFPTPVLG